MNCGGNDGFRTVGFHTKFKSQCFLSLAGLFPKDVPLQQGCFACSRRLRQVGARYHPLRLPFQEDPSLHRSSHGYDSTALAVKTALAGPRHGKRHIYSLPRWEREGEKRSCVAVSPMHVKPLYYSIHSNYIKM